VPGALDRDRIDAIVQAVADRLPGDWLLIGGGLTALWLSPRRVTEDVDIVAIQGTGADRLSLLGLANDLGLPVEALNSAADYFVYRVADWRAQVEPFRTGTTARIFRPSPTLFLLLKIRRLSGQDLDDCLALLARVATEGWPLDVARVTSALDELPPSQEPSILERRARLRQTLSGLP
jgi:hypothetical protein